MTHALVAWAPALLWAAVLFILSSQPDLSGPGWLPFGDKLGHLALYGVLGGTLAWARVRSGSSAPARHAFFLALGAFYGFSDEWHQSFVPGRDAALGDLAADTLGVALGYALGLAILDPHRDGEGPPARPGA